MAALPLPVLQAKSQGVLAEWRELESDPGLFSLLIEDYGVKGVRVEEVYDITHRFQTRVFGFVFLFRWVGDRRARKKSMVQGESFVMNTEVVNQMFFAHQIVNNSCASHALLSVLLNCRDLDLGSTLSRLKDFSTGLDPESKGLAIANMVELARAHNKHARPSHDVAPPPSRRASVVSSAHALLPETFHFVSYVPINDRLFELDGLKEFPIDHGPWGEQEEWTDLFQRIISQRLSGSGGQDIHFSLMAVVQDPLPEISQRLKMLQARQKDLLDVCIGLVREMRSGEGRVVGGCGKEEGGCEKGEKEGEGGEGGREGVKGEGGAKEVGGGGGGGKGEGGGEGGGEGRVEEGVKERCNEGAKEEDEAKRDGATGEVGMEDDKSVQERGRRDGEQVGERTIRTDDEQKMDCGEKRESEKQPREEEEEERVGKQEEEEEKKVKREEEEKKEEEKKMEKREGEEKKEEEEKKREEEEKKEKREEEEKKEKREEEEKTDCKLEEGGEELTGKVEAGGEREGQRQEMEKEVKEEEEDCKMEEEGERERQVIDKESKVEFVGESGEKNQEMKEEGKEEEEEEGEDCRMEEGKVASEVREGGEKTGEQDGAGRTGNEGNNGDKRDHSEKDGKENHSVAEKERKEGGGDLEGECKTGEDEVEPEKERGEEKLVSENDKESEESSLCCNVKEEPKGSREREETRERGEDKEREQPSSGREVAATEEEQQSIANGREEGVKKEIKQEMAEGREESKETPMDLSEGAGQSEGVGPDSTASGSGEPTVTKREEKDGAPSKVDRAGAAEPDADGDSVSILLAEVAKNLPTERSDLEEIANGRDTGSVEDRLKRAVAVFLLNDLDLESQKHKLKEEVELKQQYHVEFSRRTHDYDLLITNFLKFLAQNNQLPARLARRPSGFSNAKGIAGQKRPSGRAQLARGEAQNNKKPKTTLLVNGTKVI